MATKQELETVIQNKLAAAKSAGQDVSQYEAKFNQLRQAQPMTQPVQTQPQSAYDMTSDPKINALIQKALQPKNMGHRVGDAISILGGGQPSAGNEDLQKVIVGETVKSHMVDPLDRELTHAKIQNYRAGLNEDGTQKVADILKERQLNQSGDIREANLLKAGFVELPEDRDAGDANVFSVGSRKYVFSEDLAKTRARVKAQSEGLPAAEAGRLQGAQESMRFASDIKGILFPDGTPQSFDRGRAVLAKYAGGGTDAESQEVLRKMGDILAAKLLIQSGVTTREDEKKDLAKRYFAGLITNPDKAMKDLTDLERFYTGFSQKVDPQGVFADTGGATQTPSTNQNNDPLGLLA